MKNILKREYNKGKHNHKLYFIFLCFFNFIFAIVSLINFPEKKLGKIKRNKENVLVLYHELHNFCQSLHFVIETF